MVKFPDPIYEKDKKISYINNQYSEYIGCKIFELFGINVQEVHLGECFVDGKKKVIVLCLDFEMISLLDDFCKKEDFKVLFYKIFIVDTLLGNVDRHLGNWGLILKNHHYRLSLIYDCGSCLHPLLSLEEMENLLNDKTELKNISINLKTVYKYQGKAVTYIDLYKIMPKELKIALEEMKPLLVMDKIKEYGRCFRNTEKVLL